MISKSKLEKMFFQTVEFGDIQRQREKTLHLALLEFFDFRDEGEAMEIMYDSSVVYQPSDGYVFEWMAHNAKLTDVIPLILRKGKITKDEYMSLCI